MQLYTWQEECLKVWEEHGFHGIVHVVTGAGKTLMALHGIPLLKSKAERPLRVKIVVPTCALAVQWAAAMDKNKMKAGHFGGGRRDCPEQDYMIYVVNSARYHLARHIIKDWAQGFGVLLITDECHHYASAENQKIFDFLSVPKPKQGPYYSLGLSATPQSAGFESILVPSIGPEIYRYGFSKAAAAGNVCNFSVYQMKLSFTPEERKEYTDYSERISIARKQLLSEYSQLKGMDHNHFFAAVQKIAAFDEDSPASLFLNLSRKRQALSFFASGRILCACELIRRLPADEKIIIFCERIRQAEELFGLLSVKYPGWIGRYHSEMRKELRKRTLEQYHNGEYRILVSCKGLDEGVDVPDAETGIILSGTGEHRQHIQRLGRILRPAEGKKSACLYYLYIDESAEDSAFLSDTEETIPVCNLSYSAFENCFFHPAYEAAAVRLLQNYRKKGLDMEKEQELRRCLDEGLVRSDWLNSAGDCRSKRNKALSQHEKNYWLCMEKLTEAVPR